MGTLLATSFGLALAGLDPAGALVAIAALARRVAARAVLVFAGTVLVGTAALGTALSLTVGHELAAVDWRAVLRGGDLAAIVQLALAAALLLGAAWRLRRRAARPERPLTDAAPGHAHMAGIGCVFALSAAVDPTFAGLVVVAGGGEPVAGVALAHLLWVTISQLPLVVVAGAAALGSGTRVTAAFEGVRRWSAPVARVAVTTFLALGGIVLAADALAQLVAGRFLVLAPGA